MVSDFSSFVDNDFFTAADTFMDSVNFESFGKMNGAVYRLMFEEATRSMTTSGRNYIILLCTLVKNRSRILSSAATIPETSADEGLKEAILFIKDHMVQYVSESVKSKPMRFPVVKVPESFASVATLYAASFFKGLGVTSLISTSYFGHLDLSDFLQDLNEMYTRFAWTQVNRTTRNTTSGRTAERKVGTFYEDIYSNCKTDSLPVYDKSGQKASFDTEKGKHSGFRSLDNVLFYINANKKAGTDTVTLDSFMFVHQDWRRFHPAFEMSSDSIATQSYDYDLKTGRKSNKAEGMLKDLIAKFDDKPKLFSTTLFEIRIRSGPEM